MSAREPERVIQNRILLAAGGQGYTLWRQNTGLGWVGDPHRQPDGSLLLRHPRPLRAGLCEGSADLIGFKRILITPDLLGQTLAQFAAIEVKAPRGRLSAAQAHFLEFIRAEGGIAVLARQEGDLA